MENTAYKIRWLIPLSLLVLNSQALAFGGRMPCPDGSPEAPTGLVPHLRDHPMAETLSFIVDEVLVAGNSTALLVDGPEIREGRLAAIRSARRSIDLITFTWHNDVSGRLFADEMIAKAKEGVRVRIVTDFFNYDISDIRDEMKAAGVHFYAYNKPVGFFDVERRLHEKYMIVDGSVAFIGGVNIGDHYMHLGDHPEGWWHDFEVKVSGPIVARMQARYDNAWNEMVWEGELDKPGRGLPYCQAPTKSELAETGSDLGMFLYQRPRYHKEHRADFTEAFVRLIAGARERLVLYIPYLMPPKEILHAISLKAAEGVPVSVITNSGEYTDVPQIGHESYRDYYPEFFASGVRVFEFGGRMLHAKAILIDSDWAVIGSHNLTLASFRRNNEAALLTDSQAVIRKLEQVIEADLSASFEVTPEYYTRERQPTRRDRIEYFFARFLKNFF